MLPNPRATMANWNERVLWSTSKAPKTLSEDASVVPACTTYWLRGISSSELMPATIRRVHSMIVVAA